MKTLVRCAGSSLAAVAIEFGLLSLLVSVLHIYYMAASLICGVVGLAICFVLNRRWAFDARHGRATGQLVRHGLVVAGGIALGMALLWLQVHGLHLPYQLSWLIGGSVVFLTWTFPMQRFFTFRAPRPAVALA